MRAGVEPQFEPSGGITLWDLFARCVREAPERLALVDPPNRGDLVPGPPVRLTYRELAERADRLATAFLAEGVAAGEVILVQLPNVAELVLCYLAAARIGAILTPVPVQFRERELRWICALTEPVVAVTVSSGRGSEREEPLEAVRAGSPSLRAVFAASGAARPGAVPLDEALETPASHEDLERRTRATSSSDVLTICWTSGTEADPKGVPRTHDMWTAIALATLDGAELQPGDVLLTPFPLVNMSGIGGMLFPWLQTMGTLVLHQPLALPIFLEQIARERVNYTVAPPVLLNRLLAEPALLERADLSSLRTIGSGSAPLTPSLIQGWKQRFGIDIVNFFGSNEGVALVSGPADVPDPAARARVFPWFGAPGRTWTNRVARGMETKLVDPASGRRVTDRGEIGELLVKGPTVFHGYWRRPDLTAEAFDDEGFYRTGDLFEVVDEAHLRFVGRARELIIRGGMKIAPEEVEALLADHPMVEEVAVIGTPDPRIEGEQVVTAVVVPKERAHLALVDLRAHLRAKGVAAYKEPRKLVLVDALPRNPLGKVVKGEIRASLS